MSVSVVQIVLIDGIVFIGHSVWRQIISIAIKKLHIICSFSKVLVSYNDFLLLTLSHFSYYLSLISCCFSFAAACAPSGGGDDSGTSLFGNNNEDGDNRDIKVQLRRVNGRYEKAEIAINKIHLNVIGEMKEVKEALKKEEKARKDEEKKKQKELEDRVKVDLGAGMSTQNMRRNYRPIAFLVRFHGDMMLSSMELLRKQVSIIVNCGRAGVDRAIVVVTSPGGAVSPYGLAASQLVRIRKSGIELIVCVDTVAASGGYMMASVGDRICAAPFAIIGSIGVVTQVPNFQKFLNKVRLQQCCCNLYIKSWPFSY